MTVHGAKGLEFDVVHVTGLEQGMFPYIRNNSLAETGDQEEREEERRLFYVAMTRARKRLFLTRARARRLFGQTQYKEASSFLGDLPPDVLIDLTPQRPTIRSVGRTGSFDYTRDYYNRASRKSASLLPPREMYRATLLRRISP